MRALRWFGLGLRYLSYIHGFLILSLLLVFLVASIDLLGIYSLDPYMAVLNHYIDNGLRIFFEWLLK